MAIATIDAGAAVAPRYSLENLVDRSTVIVEGRVTRTWTAWDSEHTYIWTHYELTVSEHIRGAGGKVTISEPGGTLDGINMGTSGSLPYAMGEHVVLFLFQTPIGYWRTSGGGQGKFTITADGRVTANTQGLEIVSSGKGATGTSLSTVERMELGKFKTLVRSVMQRKAAAQ